MGANSDPNRRLEVTISTRTLLRLLLVGTGFIALAFLLWEIRTVLQLVLISTFLALALNPIVSVLERRLGNRRGIAAVIVVLVLILLVFAFLAALLTPLYNELRSLATRAPVLIDDLSTWRPFAEFDRRYNFIVRLQEAASQYSSRLPATADSLLGVATAVVTGFGKALTVLFMTLFLLLEIPRFLRATTELLHPGHADRSHEMFEQINGTVARWTAGVLLISTIAGAVTGVTAWILGVPFALALALLVAVLDVIPLIGATIGSIIVVLVAFTHSLTAGIVMLVLAVVYQFLENHIIQPVVMRKSIDVSPFVVLVSVLAGASLLGIIGALLAIPIAGSAQVVLRRLLEGRRERVSAERQLMLGRDGEATTIKGGIR